MPRFTLIAGLLAFSLFNYAQYQGWNLFADEAQAQSVRSANAARAFHK